MGYFVPARAYTEGQLAVICLIRKVLFEDAAERDSVDVVVMLRIAGLIQIYCSLAALLAQLVERCRRIKIKLTAIFRGFNKALMSMK